MLPLERRWHTRIVVAERDSLLPGRQEALTEARLPDLITDLRSPAAYNRWLVESAREAIRRSRALLEQTEPMIRNPGPRGRLPAKIRAL
jgi:hypothetical protein